MEFIRRAVEKHKDDGYNYSQVVYVNSNTPVNIICPKHGVFLQTPHNHLTGQGCPECGKEKNTKKRTKTTEQFIEDAKKVHGHKYDYSMTEYVNNKVAVTIKCRQCGKIFEQTPNRHLKGEGCPRCALQSRASKRSLTYEEFIEKAVAKHEDKYDYSDVVYKNGSTKISIKCRQCGKTFEQTPHAHLNGCGCRSCSYKHRATKQTYSREKFIEKARRVHGDRYNYDKVEYIKSHDKVCITCPDHGDFWQMAYCHLNGEKCPKCKQSRLEKSIMELFDREGMEYFAQWTVDWLGKMSLDFYLPLYHIGVECQGAQHYRPIDFANRGTEWARGQYIKATERDERKRLLCEENDVRLLYYTEEKGIKEENNTYRTHKSLLSAVRQAKPKQTPQQTKAQKEFIELATKVHNGKYDYSLVEYERDNKPVKIICPIHGVFEQRPDHHKEGHGCMLCSGKARHTRESFEIAARKIHGDKYDYSKVKYVNNYTHVLLVCNTCHKEFLIRPQGHLMGRGCSVCAKKRIADKQRDTVETFIKKAETVHGKDRYDYSKVDYKESSSKVTIKCNKCGHTFTQTPNKHLSGCGCPLCGMRVSHHEEDILAFIKDMGIEAEQSNRSILKRQELDIFIPSKRIAIEYDGLYWHSNAQGKGETYHLNKTKECAEKGVRLIHIFEDEWIKKRETVESRLRHILGEDGGERIYARQCEIRGVGAKECAEFLDGNHLQGSCQSKFRYGLYYNNELVAVMTFGRRRQKRERIEDYDEQWEMLRFCCRNNVSVIGGASRLLKHFIKEEKPKTIITYADKRWSDGELYYKLGFIHTHDSRPNYFYVVEKDRESRFKYRKSELVRQGFDESKTEKEIMEEREIPRIYDCGNMVFRIDL
ncbi:MAG: hypothetical protein LUD72_09945 [Bacteroidales bacterium]|nr:hypothetical protein [Bacteroidales bacterium]